MELSLLQTAPADPTVYLETLKSGLPKRIYARTRVFYGLVAGPDSLPRFVAHLTDATAEDEACILAAITKHPNPAFELRATAPALAAEPALRNSDDTGPVLAPWIAPALPLSAADAETAKRLENILKAAPSGIDFPEKSYTGTHKAAYNSICTQLGREPMVDKGRNLELASFSDVKKPRRPRIPDAVWTEVLDHLEFQVVSYGKAYDWFSTNGYLRNTYRDSIFFDTAFLEHANDKYGLVKDTSQTVTFWLAIANSLILKIIRQVPIAGEMFTIILSAAAEASKSQGVKDRLVSKIKDMKAEVVRTLESSIKMVEACHGAILQDWGNLSTFGTLLETGALDWPTDSQPLRDAHRYAYQYEAMRTLVEFKHTSESHRGEEDRYTWSVLAINVGHDSPVNTPRFDWTALRYDLVAATKECGSYSGKAMIVAFQECHRAVTYDYQWRCASPINQPAGFYKKLFGTSTADPTDVELAIPFSFLTDGKQREGWGI